MKLFASSRAKFSGAGHSKFYFSTKLDIIPIPDQLRSIVDIQVDLPPSRHNIQTYDTTSVALRKRANTLLLSKQS